jgi:hypothetical protein
MSKYRTAPSTQPMAWLHRISQVDRSSVYCTYPRGQRARTRPISATAQPRPISRSEYVGDGVRDSARKMAPLAQSRGAIASGKEENFAPRG